MITIKRSKQVQKDIIVKHASLKKILADKDMDTFFTLINDSYKKYHHNLLYLEELQNLLDYKLYDLHDCKIQPDTRMKKLYQIKVPGIAEKRPNILRGDQI